MDPAAWTRVRNTYSSRQALIYTLRRLAFVTHPARLFGGPFFRCLLEAVRRAEPGQRSSLVDSNRGADMDDEATAEDVNEDVLTFTRCSRQPLLRSCHQCSSLL
jgi:hypothetical protein